MIKFDLWIKLGLSDEFYCKRQEIFNTGKFSRYLFVLNENGKCIKINQYLAVLDIFLHWLMTKINIADRKSVESKKIESGKKQNNPEIY